MEDAQKKFNNATDIVEKDKQKKRYKANYESLMKLVDDFNKKKNSEKAEKQKKKEKPKNK